MLVNWYGSSAQGEGYSGASENIIVELEKQGMDVRILTPNTAKRKTITKNMTKEGLKLYQKPFMLADIGVLMGFPQAFNSIINKYKIGFTMFETDKLPSGVLPGSNGNGWSGPTGKASDMINLCNELWVPSSHNVDLFQNSGVEIPVKKIRLGVDTSMYSDMSAYRESTRKNRPFTFLMLGKLTSRKNVGAAIAAFMYLFKGNKDVQLIIKSHSGTVASIKFPDDVNIKIVDKMCSIEELQKYYAEADCFLFPSRGEGFGLPPVEAMATGLPVIFADNTGMGEFVDKKYNYPVVCSKKTKADRFPKEWGDVGNWYEVDLIELQAQMLWVYENEKEAKEKGKKAAKWVSENWTYKNTAKEIISILKAIKV